MCAHCVPCRRHISCRWWPTTPRVLVEAAPEETHRAAGEDCRHAAHADAELWPSGASASSRRVQVHVDLLHLCLITCCRTATTWTTYAFVLNNAHLSPALIWPDSTLSAHSCSSSTGSERSRSSEYLTPHRAYFWPGASGSDAIGCVIDCCFNQKVWRVRNTSLPHWTNSYSAMFSLLRCTVLYIRVNMSENVMEVNWLKMSVLYKWKMSRLMVNNWLN